MTASITLALSNWDRLGAGLLALLLCLFAMVLWLVPLIGLGRVWRRMTRARRTWWMHAVIVICLLLTVASMICVQHTQHEVDERHPQRIMYTTNHCIGITSWHVTATSQGFINRRTPGAAPRPTAVTESRRFSVIGMLALIPALIALFFLARWLWREMPGFYRRPQGYCDHCNYDLRANRSPACPECGEISD